MFYSNNEYSKTFEENQPLRTQRLENKENLQRAIENLRTRKNELENMLVNYSQQLSDKNSSELDICFVENRILSIKTELWDITKEYVKINKELATISQLELK